MDSIKIEVTGNIARVFEKPAVITSGTVGLMAEFTFNEDWENLSKTIVFTACDEKRSVEYHGAPVTVPWEVLVEAGAWLSVGVYGVNEDGTLAIPTVWANICRIRQGTSFDGDPGADYTLPVWKRIDNAIKSICKDIERMKNEPGSSATIGEVTLLAENWRGDASPYSQVVSVSGVTEFSQVDLTPSAEQLSNFYYKDIAFVTENDGGVVTVYAIGQKPQNDYTIQVTITEVFV